MFNKLHWLMQLVGQSSVCTGPPGMITISPTVYGLNITMDMAVILAGAYNMQSNHSKGPRAINR